MTDLSEVAASVSKALDLVGAGGCWDVRLPQRIILRGNGSNLTDPYWIWRCVEWLLAHEWRLEFYEPEFTVWKWYEDNEGHSLKLRRTFKCPAAEFPALAIHELMKGRK